MNRRQFIRYGGVGLAIVGGVYIFNPFEQCETMVRTTLCANVEGVDDDSLSLLCLASFAPSGHNTQPWTVRIVDHNHWIIGSDRTRWLSIVDLENRETILSVGAFLENLIIAASVKGYEIEVQVLAKEAKDKEILDRKLHKVNYTSTFDLEQIKSRRTVRNNFLTDHLSSEDIRLLTGGNIDSLFYFPRESTEGHYLAEGTLAANKVQTYSNAAQEELAKWIRWSDRDSRHYKNGLTPESMEVEGIANWYVKKFYSTQSVLDTSFREATIKKVEEQVVTGSGWLLITSKNSSIIELINAGRKLQRIWLKSRQARIAIHPMSQMLEEEPMRHQIASAIGITETVQFIVRIGRINNYPQPVSPRMLIANILV